MNATAGDVPPPNLAIGADAGDPLAAVLDAAAAAGVVWHERNEYEAKGAPCPVCGGGGRDRLRVRHGDEGVAVACSGCGSGAEFWRRFTRVIGFRWTARRPSREARRAWPRKAFFDSATAAAVRTCLPAGARVAALYDGDRTPLLAWLVVGLA